MYPPLNNSQKPRHADRLRQACLPNKGFLQPFRSGSGPAAGFRIAREQASVDRGCEHRAVRSLETVLELSAAQMPDGDCGVRDNYAEKVGRSHVSAY
jgi:hypothetical protein